MKISLLAIALVSLSGCNDAIKYTWTKPNASDQDFVDAYVRCRAKVPDEPSTLQIALSHGECMKAAGWTLSPNGRVGSKDEVAVIPL